MADTNNSLDRLTCDRHDVMEPQQIGVVNVKTARRISSNRSIPGLPIFINKKNAWTDKI